MNNYNQSPALNQAVKNNPALYELIPQKSGNKFTIKLNLPFQTRYIGNIQGDTYFKKVNLSRHQFNKIPSIAFCLDLLENEKFTWIRVFCDDGRILETSRKFVLIHGTRQTFFKQGYEKQIFLGLHLFSRAEAEKFENAEALKPDYKQLTLFS
jgi:hypothetical protein